MWAPDELGSGCVAGKRDRQTDSDVCSPGTGPSWLVENPAQPQTSWHVLGIKWVLWAIWSLLSQQGRHGHDIVMVLVLLMRKLRFARGQRTCGNSHLEVVGLNVSSVPGSQTQTSTEQFSSLLKQQGQPVPLGGDRGDEEPRLILALCYPTRPSWKISLPLH